MSTTARKTVPASEATTRVFRKKTSTLGDDLMAEDLADDSELAIYWHNAGLELAARLVKHAGLSREAALIRRMKKAP